MENLEWHPFIYEGLETNIEVTKKGQLRKLNKHWLPNSKTSISKFKFGEYDLSNLNKKGYFNINCSIKNFGNKKFSIHQIIAIVFLNHKINGHKLVIDHIDSNPLNNHLDNLRIISQRENLSKERTNKSGLPVGVHFNKKNNKYESSIRINKNRKYLGSFINIEDAANAYNEFKIKNNLL